MIRRRKTVATSRINGKLVKVLLALGDPANEWQEKFIADDTVI
jgi:hypothetical protein